MQVWQYFLMIIGLLLLLFGLSEIFALLVPLLPYVLIPNWIFLGTINIMHSFARTSFIAFIQFSFGMIMIGLAITNVFLILRRDVEDREILFKRAKVPSSKQIQQPVMERPKWMNQA